MIRSLFTICLLSIAAKGKALSTHVCSNEHKPTAFDTLRVSKTQELSTVEVTARAQTSRYDGRKMIITPAALRAAKGGSMAEGLKFVPGVEIGSQGELKLNGLSTLEVYVDGHPLRMNPQERLAYLQTLAVDEVEGIELLLEPSAEFPDAKAPLLNIRRKRGETQGVKGYSQVGTSHQHLWAEQASARVNFAHRGQQAYVYYNVSDHRNLETTTLLGRTDSLLVDNRLTHLLGAGCRLTFSPQHSLQWQTIGTWTREHTLLGAQHHNDLMHRNGNAALYYEWKRLRNVLLLNAEGALAHSGLERFAGQVSSYNPTDSRFYLLLFYFRHNPSERWGAAFNGSYQHLHSELSEQRQNWALTLQERQLKLSAYVHWSGPNWYAEVGNMSFATWRTLRLPGVNGDHTRRDWQQLPYVYAHCDLTPQYRVEFSYRNTFQLPNLRDLTPYATQASASALRTGNPELRTAYEHRWRLSVSYLRAAQLELTYQDTRDALVDAIVPQPTSYAFQRLNLESSRYVRVLLALPLPLVNNRRMAWMASTYFAQQWQWDKGAVLGEKLDEQQHSWYLRHRHTLSWNKAWYFDLGYTYYSALRYGLFRMQPQGWWEVGASHNVRNWRIAVNVYDLFNTNRARGVYAPGSRHAIAFERRWYHPKISLTLSYSWGKSSVKRTEVYERRDAQQRLNNTGNETLQLEE